MDVMSATGGLCKVSMLWNWDTIDACFVSSQWRITSTAMFAGSCVGSVLLVLLLEFLKRLQREYDYHIQAQDRKHSAIISAVTVPNTPTSSRIFSVGGSGNVSATSRRASGQIGQGYNQSQQTLFSDYPSAVVHDKQLTINTSPTRAASTASSLPSPAQLAATRQRIMSHTPSYRVSTGVMLKRQLIRSLLLMLQFALGVFIMLLTMFHNGYIIICILIGGFLGPFLFTWDQMTLRYAFIREPQSLD